jgi:hypothetical protein
LRVVPTPDDALGPVAVLIVLILESRLRRVRPFFRGLHHAMVVQVGASALMLDDFFNRIVALVVLETCSVVREVAHARMPLDQAASRIVFITGRRKCLVRKNLCQKRRHLRAVLGWNTTGACQGIRRSSCRAREEMSSRSCDRNRRKCKFQFHAVCRPALSPRVLLGRPCPS